jgi:hypothetical protein
MPGDPNHPAQYNAVAFPVPLFASVNGGLCVHLPSETYLFRTLHV